MKTSEENSTWTEIFAGLALEYQYAPNVLLNETFLYYFRLRARNGLGLSANYSNVLTVFPDKRPQGMNTPGLISAAS